jgi:type VI secretion system protein ImpC
MTAPHEPTISYSPAAPWSVGGEPVPGYRLQRMLGKGGMGEVWEAHGPGGVPTALKRVGIPGGCGQREREALDLLRHVRHPHLLALHGYWIQGDFLVIGLELAEESLATLLQRQLAAGVSGLPGDKVVSYLQDAAEALDYLGRPIHRINSHTVRIQHRDVKPANLLLQGGAVKVADFGLAKALETLLGSGSWSLTVAYAPPEFFRGQTTPTSDQYSLGVTYCELRTGRRPFAGTPEQIMHGHLHAEPNLEGLADDERAVVLRALAKDPQKRWASCVKFIGEVARTAADVPAPTPQPAAAPSPGGAETQPDSQAPTPTFHGRPVTSGLLLVAGELVPLPLKRTDVRAAITAASAEVTVTQVFVNTHARAVEATYVFPLPENAAVHRLRMYVGERCIEGVVREKEEARETYKEARAEGHGAALVEQTTPNIFTSSMANILPGQKVRVEIAYLQTLPFQEGQYRFVFPMVVSARYVLGSAATAEPLGVEAPGAVTAPRLPQSFLRGDTVSLEVNLDAGVPLCGFDSPSHDIVILEEDGATRVRVGLRQSGEIPNRDFVLSYRMAGPRLEHALFQEPGRDGQPGTFLLITMPPAPQLSAGLPREVILVLDCSGSMQGEPLKQARQAAQQLLDLLDPQDAFNLIAFDTQAAPLAAVPLAAEEVSLRRARAFLEQLRANGGTEMLEPLRLALQMPPAGGRDRVRMVLFLTDGSVTGERELLAALRPVVGRARIIAFGIGTAVNRHLLNKLTAAGRGFAEFLFPGENIARAVDRTLRRLGYAVLTDVELHWEGGAVEEVLPERCRDVYLNQPLVVLGRFRGEAPPGLTLRGRVAGEPYTARLEAGQMPRHEGGVPLAALWARQQIEALMDCIWEQPNKEAELRRKVIDLARQYSLASSYTSFLAVEYRSKAEREQARGAVAVEIPQYMPQGMASPTSPMADLQDRGFAVRYSSQGTPPQATAAAAPEDDLDKLLAATPQDMKEREASKSYVERFLREVVKPGQVIYKDVEHTINYWVAEIDKKLSAQLNEVMHEPAFQRLEGTWRGLHYLVHQSETCELLKIRVLNASKRDLVKDVEKAIEFDQSALFKKVYEEEYGWLGGSPYGLMVGDYEFGRSAEDISLLKTVSNVAATAHAPFVAAASPRLFNVERFTELPGPRDLPEIFSTAEYASWNSFRESEDSRYVALTLPHMLARLPYGAGFKAIEEFNYEEFADGRDHDKCLWMSAAWAYAARITDAFAKYGWMARTRGVEAGGKVEGLRVLTFPTDDGAVATKCPTEVALDERREFELSNLGFLPLLHSKDRDFAVFMGSQSCQKQRQYFSPDANANAELAAKLNYTLCGSRFAHYLQVMAWDRIDSFTDVGECERWLNEWIMSYVIANPENAGDEVKAKCPLADARVEIRAVPGKPGWHEVVAYLRPHFQLETLTTSMRFVARVPKRS